ncbi:MAG: branched-chain amino acid ABC transporter permease [Desulfobacteraceae bacterium]|nr:branched-chain amino acid ABC transporter permease [Desulfobacteraceae bacterium]
MSQVIEKKKNRMWLWLLITTGFFVLMPLWAPEMWLHLAIEIFIVALFAMSLNMILGRAGLPSFGHACFYAVGGYAFAILVVKLKLPAFIGLLAAPFISGLFAVIIGYFSIRLTGIHFAILTMGFGQIVWAIAHKWYSFTGGDDGITGIPIPAILKQPEVFYYLAFIMLIVSSAVIKVVQDSAFGQTIVAVRENRERVTFSGLKVWHHLLLNFVIAGFFAGIAGALLAMVNRSVFADFGYWTSSAAVVLMCILGGVGSFVGPMVGAVIITLLEHYISIYTYYWQMILGCLIIILIMFMPSGICGYIQEKLQKNEPGA